MMPMGAMRKRTTRPVTPQSIIWATSTRRRRRDPRWRASVSSVAAPIDALLMRGSSPPLNGQVIAAGTCPHQPPVEEQQNQREDYQDDRHGAAERPVERYADLVANDEAHDRHVAATQNQWTDEGAHAQSE